MAESKSFSDPEPIFKNSNWGLIKFDIKTFTYKLDIQQFMSLPKKTGEYCEMEIPTDGQSAAYWYLRVYPNGKDASSKDYVSVVLYHVNNNGCTVETQYSVELKDTSSNEIVSRNGENAFIHGAEYGFYECIKRDTLQKALEKSVNGTLTILCTIREFTDIRNEEGSFAAPNQTLKNLHSSCLLKTLLTNQAYSDFTINVKERQFKVHKAVLDTCSPVFAAMLSAEMKERENDETTVDDVEPDVFEKALEFMYTGNVTTIDADAMDLVPVAHKYELQGLLEQCEAVLCPQVSMDLAVKLLILSNLYSLEHLKDAVMKYIKAHLNAVSQTADWKTYVENDPKLLKLLLMS